MSNGVKYNYKYDAYEITPLDVDTLSRDEISKIGVYEDEIKALKNKINNILDKHYTNKKLVLSKDKFNNIFKKSLDKGICTMPKTKVGVEYLKNFANDYLEVLKCRKDDEIEEEKKNYGERIKASLSRF